METPESGIGIELLKLTRRCRGIDKYVSASARLTIDEMHCLSALFSDRPPSVKRLCELINVTPSRASKILTHLEQRGLVMRTLDSADHRRGQVMLTDAGEKTVERILSHFTEIGSEVLGTWRREMGADFSWLAEAGTHPK